MGNVGENGEVCQAAQTVTQLPTGQSFQTCAGHLISCYTFLCPSHPWCDFSLFSMPGARRHVVHTSRDLLTQCSVRSQCCWTGGQEQDASTPQHSGRAQSRFRWNSLILACAGVLNMGQHRMKAMTFADARVSNLLLMLKFIKKKKPSADFYFGTDPLHWGIIPAFADSSKMFYVCAISKESFKISFLIV